METEVEQGYFHGSCTYVQPGSGHSTDSPSKSPIKPTPKDMTHKVSLSIFYLRVGSSLDEDRQRARELSL